MKSLLKASGLLLSDLASSLVFLLVFWMTHSAVLSACAGILLGLIQIGVQFARQKPIHTMEWLSLFLVIASGVTTILTDDPRFVLFKPSVIYAVVGTAMLKPGWMNRYLPAIVQTIASDIATYIGFAWAALMFISALLNAYLAINTSLESWALTMATFGISSKVVLLVVGFAAIRFMTRLRLRAMPADKREALLISTGWRA